MTEQKKAKKTELGLQPNVAGLLCYLFGFISGIIFIVLEKKNKFVRFHALQSIVAFGALFMLGIVGPFIPLVGWMLIPLLAITYIVLWFVLMIKAYKGEMYKLPIAGDIAEKNS
ncbi:DUF4870 domain-containing protein [Candidatus Omnitrophota bacterium]